jgi:hypothetical protein
MAAAARRATATTSTTAVRIPQAHTKMQNG